MVPPIDRDDAQRALLRRLAVGLTNLGLVQNHGGHAEALSTMQEGLELAREIADWRLQVLNHLNIGVYFMTVTSPPEFARAESEFRRGYDLAINDDPLLAGRLMIERATVFYERGMTSPDPASARPLFEQAAGYLQLAAGLRDADSVLAHQRGLVHGRLGEFDQSRRWFEHAIELKEARGPAGAGADSRLHLALMLEQAGLLTEARSFAHSAKEAIAQARQPDPGLELQIEQADARLSLLDRN
jgi:tetratricopeptide (TPR) repeat protein